MAAGVYLETTIPSYLAARPSRDIIVAAHQQVTWEWWQTARAQYELFVSDAVLAEIKAGNPEAAARRLQFVEGVESLEPAHEVLALAEVYDSRLGLAHTARRDLLHVAYAAVYEVDYLLTWNCTHLANGQVIRRLFAVNAELGHFMPLIVTPDVLLGKETGDLP